MPILAFSLMRLFDTIFARLILFTLGYLSIPIRRMAFRGTGNDLTLTLARRDTPGEQDIHPGDILICNSQSPIDILYLCMRYSPTFTTVEAGTGKVIACSRWFSLLNLASPGAIQQGHHTELAKLTGHSHGPIVVFPEGTSSNGRALLPFVANLSRLPSNQRIHLIALKYVMSSGGFLPTLSVNSLFDLVKFTLLHCRQWYSVLSVKWISSTTIYSSSCIPIPQDTNFNQNISDVMAQLLHARTVSLSLTEKAAFLKAYYRK